MNAVAKDITVFENDGGDEFVRLGICDGKALERARTESVLQGRTLVDQLFAQGDATRGDVIEVMLKQGLKPGTLERKSDLPEWDVVLNDAGQKLGVGAARDPNMAIVANETGKNRRCFFFAGPAATQKGIQNAIAKVLPHGYRMGGVLQVTDELLKIVYNQWDLANQSGRRKADDSELQKEFDEIGLDAVRMKASDIHISVTAKGAEIKFRVHGELEYYRDITAERAHALCSSIYNTLAEQGSTKDGFMPEKMQDAVIERHFDVGMVRFRYSGLPIAPSGFDVTLRVIPIGVEARRKEMHELGYSGDQCDVLERIFSYSSGLILFAGTTGSGKSTTMASMLGKVAEDRPGKKIRTVEEPVEYKIAGVYQSPVKRLKGDKSDFLNALRQILRADPDILGVGEIRDGDTADLAIQAVRSGHLCVSSIHADSAPICYDRLIGMGINRLDLCSVGLVGGLIYQRLVQVLCPNCKTPADEAYMAPGDPMERVLGRVEKVLGSLDGIYVRNTEGCPECEQRGVIGRTVCAEILRPTQPMLKAISDGDSRTLWKLWRQQIDEKDDSKMMGRTAFEHAMWKMKQGYVSPESVEREFHFLDERPWEDAGE
ncbi:MAG: hypothetical protein A2580_08675 [Hydrogenophilales bacterium RIFOXYD1_FULL_62_11]|nr:MAG: hypothetical protein A2580_08675 [Hydrogenophilales bacterium RIFOXYD1_FULL_62_11]